MIALKSWSTKIGYEAHAVESREPSGCDEHPERPAERAACAADFGHFIRRWWFKPEDGTPRRLTDPWLGQRNVIDLTRDHPWLLLLKAGKLGFTEIECAYDAWAALYRHPNMRVHLFSRTQEAAMEVKDKVRFGLGSLPGWLGLEIMDGPGSDTTRQIRLRGGRDDIRTITSYPATKNTAIDLTAHHSHVDELARMPWPEETWSAVQSTIAPGGTVHILSRGQGDDYLSGLWETAQAGGTPLHPHFEPWDSRPRTPSRPLKEGEDANAAFYAETEAAMLPHQLGWFLPRVVEDALSGSGEDAYLSEAAWNGCYDPGMPPLMPGDGTPIVVALDAGVTNDLFAAVAISRHPDHSEQPCDRTGADPAVRAVQTWKPPGPGREIDFDGVEQWLRMLCLGGCIAGHPHVRKGVPAAVAGCEACEAKQYVAEHNVVAITYDPYQLVSMMQRLARERVAWCHEFNQGGDRLEADSDLRVQVLQRRLAQTGDATLTEHVKNARARIPKGEDTKLRIEKRAPSAKVDALVATSMGVRMALHLNLPQRARR